MSASCRFFSLLISSNRQCLSSSLSLVSSSKSSGTQLIIYLRQRSPHQYTVIYNYASSIIMIFKTVLIQSPPPASVDKLHQLLLRLNFALRCQRSWHHPCLCCQRWKQARMIFDHHNHDHDHDHNTTMIIITIMIFQEPPAPTPPRCSAFSSQIFLLRVEFLSDGGARGHKVDTFYWR